MLQCELYYNKEKIGDYECEISFRREELQTCVDMQIISEERHGLFNGILNKILRMEENGALFAQIRLNSHCLLTTSSLFITEITRKVYSIEVRGFSTDFSIEYSPCNKKKLYEKVIEAIEEDGYNQDTIIIREYDTYKLIELRYTKDGNE